MSVSFTRFTKRSDPTLRAVPCFAILKKSAVPRILRFVPEVRHFRRCAGVHPFYFLFPQLATLWWWRQWNRKRPFRDLYTHDPACAKWVLYVCPCYLDVNCSNHEKTSFPPVQPLWETLQTQFNEPHATRGKGCQRRGSECAPRVLFPPVLRNRENTGLANQGLCRGLSFAKKMLELSKNIAIWVNFNYLIVTIFKT